MVARMLMTQMVTSAITYQGLQIRNVTQDLFPMYPHGTHAHTMLMTSIVVMSLLSKILSRDTHCTCEPPSPALPAESCFQRTPQLLLRLPVRRHHCRLLPKPETRNPKLCDRYSEHSEPTPPPHPIHSSPPGRLGAVRI